MEIRIRVENLFEVITYGVPMYLLLSLILHAHIFYAQIDWQPEWPINRQTLWLKEVPSKKNGLAILGLVIATLFLLSDTIRFNSLLPTSENNWIQKSLRSIFMRIFDKFRFTLAFPWIWETFELFLGIQLWGSSNSYTRIVCPKT